MKRAATVLLVLVAFVLASCAGTANYPISLSYQPQAQSVKTGSASVKVALFADKRSSADKRVIGTKEGGAQFMALVEGPAVTLSKAMAEYLKNSGFSVDSINEEWDGDLRSLRPGQGDILIGGTLDELALNVKGNFLKTEYDCSVKLTLSIAAPRTGELLHREKFEVSTSYVTVSFSRDKAEELINKALAEAVERGLANIDKYIKK